MRRSTRFQTTLALLLLAWTGASAASKEALTFDIPEGDARETLRQYKRQSGVPMLFGYDDVRGILTHAISGSLDAESAIREMLRDTRIRYAFTDRGILTLTVEPATQSSVSRSPSARPPGPVPGTSAAPLPGVTILGTPAAWRRPGEQALTLTRLDIERSGLATLADLIHTLPQVFGGGPTEDTREVGREARSNSGLGVGVNIRGLDAGSTLVLLDGHRLASGGSEGAWVDISNIPLVAVERVDLLPASGSARYGADAAGGVVNIVTRDGRAPMETSARFGGATAGGRSETQLGQWLTTRWRAGDAQLALEYYTHDALPASSSSQTQSDLTGFGGDNWDTNLANPGTLFAGGKSWALPKGQNGKALSPADLVQGQNRANRLEGADVVASQRRGSLFGAVHQQLTPEVVLFGNALATERDAHGRGSPFSALLPVPPSNPYYVNPSAIAGPVKVGYSFGKDFGPADSSVRVSTRSGALGVQWSPQAWSVTGDVSFGSERQRQTTTNLVDPAALLEALKDPEAATAFNAFADGSYTNPRTLERIRSFAQFTTASETRSAALLAERELYGNARLSVGADQREQRFRSVARGPGDSMDARRDVARRTKGVFAELTVPVVPSPSGGDSAAPRVELLLAARHDQFSDFGPSTVPQLGVDWIVSPGWTVRGSWRQSLRPPNLSDLIETTNVALVMPQINPRTHASVPALIWSGNNAALRPERARSSSLGVNLSPPEIPAWSLAVTYYRVDFRDRVSSPPFDSALLFDPQYSARVTLNPTPEQRAAVCDHALFFGAPGGCLDASVTGIVDLRLRNAAALRTRGVDLTSRYAMRTPIGGLNFAFNGTYVFTYAQALTDGGPFVERVSTPTNPPNLRLRASGWWEGYAWNAAAFLNYTNHYRDTRSAPARNVSAWTTVDLNAGYVFRPESRRTRGQTALALSLQNIFDQPPPFLNNPIGIGYDQENADPTGRVAALTIRHTW